MQRYFFLSLVCTLLLALPSNGQPFGNLKELKDHTVRVYYSIGHEPRATAITQRVDKAMACYQQLLQFKPAVTLLVLTQADWTRHTTVPLVYGMPHYANDTTLVVAAEDNPFWKSFLPPLEQLPQGLRQQVQKAHQGNDGHLSMQPFFDLLALHELGHAFHFQAGLNMQRKWMGELFVNILLHTYIAEKEPASLPALTVFPQMVVGNGAKEFRYTSLADVEERYDELGQQYPKNYGWYQCRWHSAAAAIYDAGGKQVSRELWNALKGKKETLPEAELVPFLATAADNSIADMVRNWDRDTIQ